MRLVTAGRILASSRQRSRRPMRRLWEAPGGDTGGPKLGPLINALAEPLSGDRPVSRGIASQ